MRTQIDRLLNTTFEGFVIPSYSSRRTTFSLKIQGPSSMTLFQSPKHENWSTNKLSSIALKLTSFARLQAYRIFAKKLDD